VKPLSVRWSKHVSSAMHGSDVYLHKSIRKYGVENFRVEQIGSGTREQALAMEQLWIAELNTKAPNGYNLTDGGDGVVGFTHSNTTKQKLRIARGRQTFTSEQLKARGRAWLGKRRPPFSDEHRHNLSTAHSGKTPSGETRSRMSIAQLGRSATPGAHIRWHARRGIIKQECTFCRP